MTQVLETSWFHLQASCCGPNSDRTGDVEHSGVWKDGCGWVAPAEPDMPRAANRPPAGAVERGAGGRRQRRPHPLLLGRGAAGRARQLHGGAATSSVASCRLCLEPPPQLMVSSTSIFLPGKHLLSCRCREPRLYKMSIPVVAPTFHPSFSCHPSSYTLSSCYFARRLNLV